MRFLTIVLVFTLAGVSLAAPAKKKPAAKKTVSARANASSSKTSARKTAARKGRKGTAAAAPRPVTASVPSSERYKVIQQALAEKGYLKAEPTGVWDQQSAEAMKQYQTDRKLPPTGKLTAASLIGLGVGGSASETASAVPPAGSPVAPRGGPSQ